MEELNHQELVALGDQYIATDAAKAIEYYEKAAKEGYAPACERLFTLSESAGRG